MESESTNPVTPVEPLSSEPKEVTTPTKPKQKTKIYQILYYILGVIEALLATRFLLLLFGANIDAGFAQLIKTLTDPLMTPFVGLFPPRSGETAVFSASTLAAMIVYAILFYGLAQLIKIFSNKKP